MDLTSSIADVLKHELWHTEQRGTTTVGFVLLLVVVACLISGVEKVLASKKASRVQNEKSRVNLATLLVASAKYTDSNHTERVLEATIEHPIPSKFLLSISESVNGVASTSERVFSNVESLARYLETQTILRIGDFREPPSTC